MQSPSPTMAGVPPTYIAAQLGHASAKMLFEKYARWIGDGDSGAARDRMVQAFGGSAAKLRAVGGISATGMPRPEIRPSLIGHASARLPRMRLMPFITPRRIANLAEIFADIFICCVRTYRRRPTISATPNRLDVNQSLYPPPSLLFRLFLVRPPPLSERQNRSTHWGWAT